MSIDVIYRLGDDALDNQAIIVFQPLLFLTEMDPLQFRISSFSIPEFSIGTYPVSYKTQTFNKPNGRIETPTAFSFSFRADKYWAIYQLLLRWKNLIGDDVTGAMAEDVGALSGESSFRTDFSVMTLDSNGIITSQGWHFTKAWLQSLGSVSFDQTSDGQPINVDVTLEYVKCIPGLDA